MDKAERGASWLESFPPHIWAYFVCHIPGEQLGRLMTTGATLLRHRLKSPKVVKSIKLGQDYPTYKSWPTFLKQFPSLEELVINTNHYGWVPKIGLTIDLIPSGVRKLELSGNWGECVGDKLFGTGVTLKLSEHLPHLEVLNVRSLVFANYSWMTHSPQSLMKLSLPEWDGRVQLPASLIEFEADMVRLSAPSFVSILPSSLESFVADELVGFELLVPLLPSSLRKFFPGEYLNYSNGPRSSQNFFEQLPKSLTSLGLPEAPHNGHISFEAIFDLDSLLSSSLTELQIFFPDIPFSAWPLFPQQLTKLSLYIPREGLLEDRRVNRNDGSFSFAALPKSITSLELLEPTNYTIFYDPPAAYGQTYFPPQLTYLNISDVQISPKAAKFLPSTLTYLRIANLCEQVCEHLPKGLQNLAACGTLMSPNLLKFLPKSLTFLDMSFHTEFNHWFDYNTGNTIKNISKHPEYSIHQNCISNRFDWKNAAPLPPTLTFFELRHAREISETYLLHQQLPNLLVLNFKDSVQFSDRSFPLTSPHLTTLNLSSSTKVSGKSFRFLPRSLTELYLNSSELIYDVDIQHLPRTLKHASLDRAIHLTDSCISGLPPHLEFLVLHGNYKITRSCVPYLPYSLRSSLAYMSVQLRDWYISCGEIQWEPKFPWLDRRRRRRQRPSQHR